MATGLSYTELFRKFLRFGFLAWGGPVAQIALMHEELVIREQWVNEDHFKKVLGIYQALPGPEATELAVYFGYIKKGRWGGLLSGLGFVLPGFFLVLLLSFWYVHYGLQLQGAQAFLYGVKPAIIALIAIAIYRIGSRSITNSLLAVVAACTAAAYFLVPLDLIVLLLGAGVFYYILSHAKKHLSILPLFPLSVLPTLAWNLGPTGDIFFFFLKAGLLTFGGAYTVIPFVQSGAIGQFGWLSQSQFLDGLAISSVVPGPLIIVSTFVGYMAGDFTGAIVATLAIFLPAFAFTLIGFSTIQKLIHYQPIHTFLDGLTAGVVVVIALSSLTLAHGALVDSFTLILFLVSLAALWKYQLNIAWIILGSGLAGLLVRTIGVWHL